MKVIVDEDLCISCGLCMSLCPEVFDWNADDKSQVNVDTVPKEEEDCTREAIDSCPTEAIIEK